MTDSQLSSVIRKIGKAQKNANYESKKMNAEGESFQRFLEKSEEKRLL